MENPDLPQEILLEIFSRIPTKSVGKCRTLSKSWKSHLSANSFIKKHLVTRKETIQQEHLALTSYSEKDILYIVTSPTKQDEVLQTMDFKGTWLKVIGSCNGLVLINKLVLLNPITLKQVEIPFTQLTKERQHLGTCGIECGFGYDSCSDDYKLVYICSYSSKNENGGWLVSETFVDVYSVKNGVWKTLGDGCYPYAGLVPKRYAFEGGAFLNGALHWLICSKDEYRSCIAVFDMGNEVFSEIALPKGFVRQLPSDVYGMPRVRRSNGVSVVGGCLLIVDNHGNGATDVWIMKEYGVAESWVKFRIQSEDGNYKWDLIVSILCYVGEGELMCLTNRDFLFACDLKEGTVRRVVLGECDAWFASGMAFVDSLVSPEGSS